MKEIEESANKVYKPDFLQARNRKYRELQEALKNIQ